VNLFGFKLHRSYILLIGVCVIGVLLRLWLLDKRWISVDEGAHLMDALLALQGNVPGVDYHSRQPLYTYVNAGFLHLFGITYLAGRLQTVVCSLLTGIMIFFIAKELVDERVAILSAVMFWLMPLEVTNSVEVNTISLTMFLATLSFYGVIRFGRSGHVSWLISAGVMAGMAFYVRQSALILLPVAFGILLLSCRGKIRDLAKGVGLFLGGYIAVILCAMAVYWRFMSPGTLLTSFLNPLSFLAKAVSPPTPDLIAARAAARASIGPYESGSWTLYQYYVHEALSLHGFLVVALVFSAFTFGWNLIARGEEAETACRQQQKGYAFLYLWVFTLCLAYGYYYYSRGFYIDYFREFLPPLVIICSGWLLSSFRTLGWKVPVENLVLVGLSLSVLWFVVASQIKVQGIGYLASASVIILMLFGFAGSFRSRVRRSIYVLVFISLLALVLISRQPPLKSYLSGILPSVFMIGMVLGLTWALLEKSARPPWRKFAQFVALSIGFAAFVAGINHAAVTLGLAYDASWSPATVKQVVSYLRSRTSEEDEIMSGGVIWEFEAGRKPFHLISHPLAFEETISAKQRAEITQWTAQHPPKVIILDGYTEKTYLRQVPSIVGILDSRYEPGIPIGATTRKPVVGYRFKERALAGFPGVN
jgi:hypothetical protein